MADTILTERGETVNVDSLGYIAYQRAGTWEGVCEPFPSVTVSADSGSGALNAIKNAIAQVRVSQA